MNAELLKRCKIKDREKLPGDREILFVDLHGFDIVQTSPRFAVFERDKDFYRFVGGSNDEAAARSAYDATKEDHRERSSNRR